MVPFGRQLLEGFIVEADEAPDASLAIKSIVDVVGTEPWFDEEMELPTGLPSTTSVLWQRPCGFLFLAKKALLP